MLTALCSLPLSTPGFCAVFFWSGITISTPNAMRADQPLTYCTHTKHINIISHIFGILNISKPYSFASDVYKFIHFRRLTVIEIVIGSISERRTGEKTKELYRRLCEGIESHSHLWGCQCLSWHFNLLFAVHFFS